MFAAFAIPERQPADHLSNEARTSAARCAHSLRVAVLAVACAGWAPLGTGCDRPAEAKPQAQANEGTAERVASAPSVDPSTIDQGLRDEIIRVAKSCLISSSGILSCSMDDARLKLAEDFNTGVRSRIKALPTLAALLASDDTVTVVVASEILATAFASSLGKDAKPGDVSSDVSKSLIEGYRGLEEYRGHRIIPAATHAAVLSGDDDALYEAMVQRKDLQGIYRMIRRIMIHGRLTVLDKVQKALASTDPALSMAAMESIRFMEGWTADEQNVLCPVVLSYLSGPPGPLAARASQAYRSCNGPHLAPLITAMQARLAAGQLQHHELGSFYARCREPVAAVDPDECQRAVAFLESVAADKKNPEQVRAAALSNLSSQLPSARSMPDDFDKALVARLKRKFGKDRSSLVAAAAKRITVQ
jgi:hypothetical protein